MSKPRLTLAEATVRARKLLRHTIAQHSDFGRGPTELKGHWAELGSQALLHYPEPLAGHAPKHRHAYEEARHGGARLIRDGHTLPVWGRSLMAAILDGSLPAPKWPKRQADRFGAMHVYFMGKDLEGRGVPLFDQAEPWVSCCGALATAMREAGLKPSTPAGVYESFRDYQGLAAKLEGAVNPTDGDVIEHRGLTAIYLGAGWQIPDLAYDRPWAPRAPMKPVGELPG